MPRWACHVDKAGWRLRGKQHTLWGAFNNRFALLTIAMRSARDLLEGNQEMFPPTAGGPTASHLPLRRRQLCWAHLRRDFKAHGEGIGAKKELGEQGLRVCGELFWQWEVYVHTGQHARLQPEIRQLRRELKPILRQ